MLLNQNGGFPCARGPTLGCFLVVLFSDCLLPYSTCCSPAELHVPVVSTQPLIFPHTIVIPGATVLSDSKECHSPSHVQRCNCLTDKIAIDRVV